MKSKSRANNAISFGLLLIAIGITFFISKIYADTFIVCLYLFLLLFSSVSVASKCKKRIAFNQMEILYKLKLKQHIIIPKRPILKDIQYDILCVLAGQIAMITGVLLFHPNRIMRYLCFVPLAIGLLTFFLGNPESPLKFKKMKD